MLSIFSHFINSYLMPILQIKKSRLRDPLSLPPHFLSPFIPRCRHLLWARPSTSLKTCLNRGEAGFCTRTRAAEPVLSLQGAGAGRTESSRQSEPPTREVASSLFLVLADIHGLHPGGGEPLPAAVHLLARAHPPVHQQKDRGDAPAHLRHRRQLLLQHETQQPRPVLHHQVGAPAPVWSPSLNPLAGCPPCGPAGRTQLRMAVNAAQHKIANSLKTLDFLWV